MTALPKQESVFLAEIDFDNSPKTRASFNDEAIHDYAELYKGSNGLPPPILFLVGKSYLIGDGWHRCKAACSAKLLQIPAIVHRGVSSTDCTRFAVSANHKNAVRRTIADRRECVKTALTDFPGWSDAALAKTCGVSDKTVAAVRKDMATPPTETRTGADGRNRRPRRKRDSGQHRNSDVEASDSSENHQNCQPETPTAQQQDSETVDPKKAAVDDTGHRIPNTCRETWERRSEIQDLMTMVSRVKCAVEKGLKERDENGRDPLFAHVRQSTITQLEGIYAHLSLSKPFALCPGCSGQFTLMKGCQQCHNSGFIGSAAWEVVPPITRKMRDTNKG
ncbi:MAG TPA: hypothetical protein VF077_13040 [Nitrospiraceae bacterium]